MSLEKIQRFLLTYNLHPNKLLGQNFMVEASYYPKLCSYATIEKSDVVLDAGAGFGFLTRFLADKCRAVVAVEKDPHVALVLRKQLNGLDNVKVVEGDFLKVQLPPFNKVIAIPPYYLSTQLVIWLLDHPVDCAVMIVQKEFAQRLIATVGSEEYGWLTVVAGQQAKASLLDNVPKEMFYPAPEVDSVILSLKPYCTKPFEVKNSALFVQLTKWLFTQRNKKLAKATASFLRNHYKIDKQQAEQIASNMPFHDKRPRELTPKDFGAIADALPN
jgi:16S rRNA (adenine1518-N6/adenine1519-N6)-dimethyltransferase